MSIHNVPGSLYDAATRVAYVHAVVGSLLESLPCGETLRHPELALMAVNRIGDLAGAADDLLKLLKADVEQVEVELKRRPCGGA